MLAILDSVETNLGSSFIKERVGCVFLGLDPATIKQRGDRSAKPNRRDRENRAVIFMTGRSTEIRKGSKETANFCIIVGMKWRAYVLPTVLMPHVKL